MSGPTTVTAAVLVIGDEILSGRTKDRNLGYIAEYLAKIGVDVREARVVPDVEDEIVAALNALRARYDYVVTTGGIGPTHDDITADSVGARLRRPDRRGPAGHRHHARALCARRSHAGAPAHGAHPRGAELIENPISQAPGFRIGNVFVMAGVPAVMQAMLDFAVKTMRTGAVMLVETIEAGRPPGGLLRRRPRRDRRRPSRTCDRLLSVVQGRALQQPDRGARQGRGRSRRGQARRRGDGRGAEGRRGRRV